MSGDIRLGLQLLPGYRFRVILEGSIEDINSLETDVFQPPVAEQLAAAIEAKADQLEKENEQ